MGRPGATLCAFRAGGVDHRVADRGLTRGARANLADRDGLDGGGDGGAGGGAEDEPETRAVSGGFGEGGVIAGGAGFFEGMAAKDDAAHGDAGGGGDRGG